MNDKESITFWYIPKSKMDRGQGKRANGMITGGMSANVTLPSRIETTIGEMRKHVDNITQKTIRVNYKDVLIHIELDDLCTFLSDPDGFTFDVVSTRLATAIKMIDNDYAYNTIDDFEQISGLECNEPFRIGWDMARRTNSILGI